MGKITFLIIISLLTLVSCGKITDEELLFDINGVWRATEMKTLTIRENQDLSPETYVFDEDEFILSLNDITNNNVIYNGFIITDSTRISIKYILGGSDFTMKNNTPFINHYIDLFSSLTIIACDSNTMRGVIPFNDNDSILVDIFFELTTN